MEAMALDSAFVHPPGPHGGEDARRIGPTVADQRLDGESVSRAKIDFVATVIIIDQDEVPRSGLLPRQGKADGRELG